jgi:phospholipase/lecithinase/hemolysin
VKFVFIGTLLPQRDCLNDGTVIECAVLHADNTGINNLNTAIKSMAGVHGAIAVDLNAAFKTADPTSLSLISNDGLHPTTAGFTLIAQTFYNALVANVPVVAARLPSAVR